MWVPTYRKFKDTLQSMCRMTTPYGCESYVWPHLPSPPFGGAPKSRIGYIGGSTQIDDTGNYTVRIPGRGERVMWTAHCDTADDRPTIVNQRVKNDMLYTDGRSILGADDKVGCTIMAMMIRSGCPGTYCFFAGEEVGCVGSGKFAEDVSLLDYDSCISIDRKGYNSIITHQRGKRTASDGWAGEMGLLLSEYSNGDLKMAPDPTGVFTDSCEFEDLIPECTNLSCGYFAQHTHSEKADMAFAYKLCCTLIKLVHGVGVPAPQRDIVVQSADEVHEDIKWWRDSITKRDWDMLEEDDWRTS